MRKFKNWAWLLFFGSLWGIMEVAGRGVLSRYNMPHSAVIFAAWAFMVMAVARGIVNKPGSSTVIGIVAVIFKLANAAPFFCHLLGIFALGLAFDVFSSLLMKNERKISFRSSLTGALSAYSGYALFAIVITYIVQYKYWIAGGLPKVLNHIFVGGSLAALAAVVLVPFGYWVGISNENLFERRPVWTYAGTLMGVVLLWTLGRFVG